MDPPLGRCWPRVLPPLLTRLSSSPTHTTPPSFLPLSLTNGQVLDSVRSKGGLPSRCLFSESTESPPLSPRFFLDNGFCPHILAPDPPHLGHSCNTETPRASLALGSHVSVYRASSADHAWPDFQRPPFDTLPPKSASPAKLLRV